MAWVGSRRGAEASQQSLSEVGDAPSQVYDGDCPCRKPGNTKMNRCTAALVVLLFLPSLAIAGSFKILKAGATPLSELSVQSEKHPGTVDRYVPKSGEVLLLAELEIELIYEKGEDDFDSDHEIIGVYDGSKRLPAMFDFCELTIKPLTPNLVVPYRSGDQKVGSRYFRMIVVAPANKDSFTFKISPSADEGKKKPKASEAPLKVAGKPKPFSYTDYMSIKIESIKFLDSVKRSGYASELRTFDYTTSNPGGAILAVQVTFVPKPSFLSPESAIAFDVEMLGLTFGKGGSCACLGYRDPDSGPPHDHVYRGNFAFGTKGDHLTPHPSEKPVILYFPVPSNLRAANITLGGHQLNSFEIPATVKP